MARLNNLSHNRAATVNLGVVHLRDRVLINL